MTFELGTHCLTYIRLVYADPELRQHIDSFCASALAHRPGRTMTIHSEDPSSDRGVQLLREDYERMGVGRGTKPSFRLTSINEHFKVAANELLLGPL